MHLNMSMITYYAGSLQQHCTCSVKRLNMKFRAKSTLIPSAQAGSGMSATKGCSTAAVWCNSRFSKNSSDDDAYTKGTLQQSQHFCHLWQADLELITSVQGSRRGCLLFFARRRARQRKYFIHGGSLAWHKLLQDLEHFCSADLCL